jgi:type IV secretion system protein VirD4
MGLRTRIACLGVGAIIGLSAATQIVAWRYNYQPVLGWGLVVGDKATTSAEREAIQSSKQSRAQTGKTPKNRAAKHAKSPTKIYPPWNFLIWQKKWGHLPAHQNNLRVGVSLLMFGFMAGLMLMKLFDGPNMGGQGDLALANRKQRARGWGDRKTLIKAGFTKPHGAIFGRLDRESLLDRWPQYGPDLLVTSDLRPMLVTGGTRSGKGRGIVVPTLLNWTWSALIFDPKAELWATSAGYRRTLGPTLFFNPRSPYTARFNPLAEINPGQGAVGQVKQLVEILIEPSGANGNHDFWDRQGADMLCALILHVLFTAKPEDKNLVTVRDLSADLDHIAAEMIATRHVANPRASSGNQADKSHICHPYIAQAAKAYASAHEKGRKSVQMTVRSYLNWIAGSEVEYAVSASDFRIGDLMCNKQPVSLYIQVSPGDLKALQPLVRLFFHMTATAFTTHMETDGDGRPKENALLMALDEFPLLGKVSFFEDVVRLASGYGIKCLFIAQSLNDIARIYGPHNGFLDNAHIYVAFAALDPVTRDKVSKLTGTITETRVSSSLPHHFSGQGGSRTLAEVERPLLDVSEVGALADDQQLIFIAGHRPYLLPKLRYDKVGWMAKRAVMSVPDQRKAVDTPERPDHPWASVTTFGFDPDVEITLSGDNGANTRVRPGAVKVDKPNASGAAEQNPIPRDMAGLEQQDSHTPIYDPTSDASETAQAARNDDAQQYVDRDDSTFHIAEVSNSPSALETVRQSWAAPNARRNARTKPKSDQTEFDFDAPQVAPANDANGADDDDLFARLHTGER